MLCYAMLCYAMLCYASVPHSWFDAMSFIVIAAQELLPMSCSEQPHLNGTERIKTMHDDRQTGALSIMSCTKHLELVQVQT